MHASKKKEILGGRACGVVPNIETSMWLRLPGQEIVFPWQLCWPKINLSCPCYNLWFWSPSPWYFI